jgi:hypothetical protein
MDWECRNRQTKKKRSDETTQGIKQLVLVYLVNITSKVPDVSCGNVSVSIVGLT